MRKKLRILFFFIFVALSIFLYSLYLEVNKLTGNSIVEIPKCSNQILEKIDIQAQTTGNISVHFLNVSQGDSIFISNKNQNMLIDCGPNGKGDEISNYLKNLGVKEISYLVITHTDADHIGGCEEILKNFNVDVIFMDGQVKDTQSYSDVIKLIDLEQLIIPDVCFSTNLGMGEFQIIHGNVKSENANQNSLVLTLKYGKTGFLLTGDCDSNCEKSLFNQNIDVDFLKVGHHCSEYGTTNEFLEKTTPKIAFISVGKNSYGHPTENCLSRLNNRGISIYRTDLNGHIVLKTDGENYWVSSEK